MSTRREEELMYVTQPDLEPATDAQISLIAKLIKEREVGLDLVTDMRSMWRKGLLTLSVASHLLSLLTRLPKKDGVEEEVEDLSGLHRYDGRIYQVVLSKNGVNYSNLLHFENGEIVRREYWPEAMKFLSEETRVGGVNNPRVIYRSEILYDGHAFDGDWN